jgi:hypothetical protein
VGFWLPWDPEPSDVADQEYADDQLNQLMKKYKENETQRDEFYAEEKQNRIKGAKGKAATVVAEVKEDLKEAGVTDMFAGEDLAIKRKRELAEAKAVVKEMENVITHG